MARDYIELWNSDKTIGGKFPVLYDGYAHILHKNTTVEETIGGGMDVQMGNVYETYVFIVRVRDEDNEGFGTRDDLEALYRLNSPFDIPSLGEYSNVITMKTHTMDEGDDGFGVYMIGDFSSNLVSVDIEGAEAIFDVKVVLRKIPDA